MKSRAAVFLLRFFHDRDRIGDLGAFVDGHFVDDLNFLGNGGVGFVNETGFDIAGLHRSQGRADILHRNHLRLDLIPQALRRSGIYCYRRPPERRTARQGDPFDVGLQ